VVLFKLLLKVISTPNPPSAANPSRVMFGPGLLLQSVAVSAAFTVTGNGSSVMLMCGSDDEEALNAGPVGVAERDPSWHAPASRNGTTMTPAFSPPKRVRKVFPNMMRSSLQGSWLGDSSRKRERQTTCRRVS